MSGTDHAADGRVDVPKIAERAAKQAPRSCEEGAISWECHQRYSNMGIIYDN